MSVLRDLGIQRKMQVMNLLICGSVLLVAVAALFVFQVLTFRANFLRDTDTLAAIIANNSTAAMAFKDEQTASEVVGALQAKPNVISASLVASDGSLLARFGKPESAAARSQFPPPGESRFVGGQLLSTQSVKQKREYLGTLYLRSDYHHTFLQLLGLYGQVVLGIIIVSTFLGGFLANRLGRNITHPVLELDHTARIIAEQKDYSVRAAVTQRGDELGRLTDSFNDMLSRIQSQDAALSRSQEKMEALINSIDGIVWERDPQTLRFRFVSRQSQSILGYSPKLWLDQSDFWSAKLHAHDAGKTIEAVHHLAGKGHPYTIEYRLTAGDGRTVWIQESGNVLIENGCPLALRGIWQDVTRQKLDAEQLDKLNRKLIDTSRQAGMAEVATGVLHNVGNVLNSVGVAATVVRDRLRQSKLPNLRRATAMLREQNGTLVDFLTSDPKGKILPEYLCRVTEELAEEQSKLVAKMESVAGHVEHMKEIVAMQQSYARVSGAYENISATDLVEDALRINLAAFDRHGIDLVRNFEPNLPKVCVDRHKVLQILINILRNAKYAMEGAGCDAKHLMIRIALESPDKVLIGIRDNGVGIAADNLTRIFQHGFTTKKDGHGFGLHSGANAAKEMGGSLIARSDGLGKGAEFILALPVARIGRPAAQLVTT